MMMMMMREANRTRDAMIELSPPPPQKTDTNTRVESAQQQQQQKEQKRTHTMTVRLLICVFSRGRCICNISADLIKNHTTSKRLFCTVFFLMFYKIPSMRVLQSFHRGFAAVQAK